MQEEEKTVVQTLYLFMYVALFGSLFVLASALWSLGWSFNSFSVSGLVGVITCLVNLALLRLEKYALPRLILPSVVYALATYLIFTGVTVSVRDDAVALFSLTVAMSGLLLGKRGVIIFGALSVVSISVSVYAEINGIIVNYITPETTTYHTFITVSVIYGLTFTMMYILVNILTAHLSKVRANQHEITEINQQLWAIRETLEKQVEERTRAAEDARRESEAARRAAESQSWVTRGQAQLAEKMRGDLDIPTLADNITSFLGSYIGAHCGALFLTSGDLLKLTGRYAYKLQDGQKSEFRFGEGLVGESARTRRSIRVTEIPPDAPMISSALGDSLPREILVVPLEDNGRVLGVIEFASLRQFSSNEEWFLSRVSESIAIAFRTAQTRVEMNNLLMQAQAQSEHLREDGAG